MSIDWSSSTARWVLSPEVGARAFPLIDVRLVMLYDRGMKRVADHLYGDASGLHLASTRTIAHEFGHVLQATLEGDETFKLLVAYLDEHTGTAAATMPPFTWYAKEHPERESFAEAYAAFTTDPAWLQAHYPQVHEWFAQLIERLPKQARTKAREEAR